MWPVFFVHGIFLSVDFFLEQLYFITPTIFERRKEKKKGTNKKRQLASSSSFIHLSFLTTSLSLSLFFLSVSFILGGPFILLRWSVSTVRSLSMHATGQHTIEKMIVRPPATAAEAESRGSLDHRATDQVRRPLPLSFLPFIIYFLLLLLLPPQAGAQETALIVASRHGFVQLVDTLLARGARVDMTDRFGNTALAAAEASTSMPSEEARAATIARLSEAIQQASGQQQRARDKAKAAAALAAEDNFSLAAEETVAALAIYEDASVHSLHGELLLRGQSHKAGIEALMPLTKAVRLEPRVAVHRVRLIKACVRSKE
jgi:hypothetical protein